MALYEVLGCLGTVVAKCNSTDECMVAVLKEVQMNDNTKHKYAGAISRLAPGGLAFKDVKETRIVVRRIE